MTHSENMTQKSDYQLNRIIANKPTYSENQIKAAFEELKRRRKATLKVEVSRITLRSCGIVFIGILNK